ncbi:MAG: glutamine amidotransferase [Pseudomonadota bacterium]
MIEASRLLFDPLIAWPWVWTLAGIGALALLVYGIQRGRAPVTRLLGLIIILAALTNPSLVQEDREPLPSVVGVVVDRSDSMTFGERTEIANAALRSLQTEMDAEAALDVRTIEIETSGDGTRLIGALEGLLADVPRDRIAGSILITDGQVHDVPEDPARLTELGPIHSLVTGDPDAGDRRITLVEAPNFGIVGETANFVVRVDDPDGGRIGISVAVNGGREQTIFVEAGEDQRIPIEIERRGDNIVVFEAPSGRRELTLANNRTAATLSGVRDGLRVLLVTGRPNSAGRVWRDLLKSDPSVDLVHFTILRPPYKQDITPLEEMALIAFPTEELFEEKLTGFDLLIFDQYERRGVITMGYLADVARYVEEGGALLIVAGEDFAGPASLARTPLAGVLPALPTGDIVTERLVPELSDAGRRHTVTEALQDDDWGAWLRYVEAVAETGDVLMTAPDGAPLLAVDRVGEGRVGQLLSDQIWLWARGYDGGGPFADLIRRMVHWLMKEPELDERQLQLIANGDTVQARLRTLADRAAPLLIETPDGAFLEPEWREDSPGSYSTEVPVDQLGLYRAQSGGLETVALNGPANPREFAALEATQDVLGPLVSLSGGGSFGLEQAGDVPDMRLVGRTARAEGSNWLGLRERGAYAVRSSTSLPLLPGLIGVLIALGLLMFAWRREGS